MSVRTTADEKLDEARENLRSANKALITLLDEDTWGHQDYSEEFLDKVLDAVLIIKKLSRDL